MTDNTPTPQPEIHEQVILSGSPRPSLGPPAPLVFTYAMQENASTEADLNPPGIIDLFSGGGGLSLGAHHAGYQTLVAVEADQTISGIYKQNFPSTRLLVEDIRDLDPRTLLESLGKGSINFRGIVGGPPCQGFSVIGNRDPHDKRNELIGEYFRFVRDLAPAFFFLENVPGLLSETNRHVLEDELDRLSGTYRILGPERVNAEDFGAPTSRLRTVVAGIRLDEEFLLSDSDFFRPIQALAPTVREAISDLPHPEDALPDGTGECWISHYAAPVPSLFAKTARENRLATPSTERSATNKSTRVSGFQTTVHSASVIERFARTLPGTRDQPSRCPRLDWEGRCPTLRAGTGPERGSFQSVRPIHPEAPRVITVREAARLQGFPDWFRFHPTKWHSFRAIGNSVAPPLAEVFLARLRSGGNSK